MSWVIQSLYSQQHNKYGRREVFKKDFIDLERTSYLDFFFLQDDKWEEFLTSILLNIQERVKQRQEKIDDKVMNEVIPLFVQAGIEQEQQDDHFKDKLICFLVRESK